MPQPPASTTSTLPDASAPGAPTEAQAKTRSTLTIVLIACLIAIAGSVISILCSAISAWLTGSGYVVAPGGRF
jgi:hypothetical protein